MGIQQLLADHGIPYATEGKHCTQGWVNIHCPFCAGGQDYHMGIHEDGIGAHCWRCGAHPVTKVLARVLGRPEDEVKRILQKYIGRVRRKTEDAKVSILPLRFPEPNAPLTRQYKNYLHDRGLHPGQIERQWGVRQTGPASYLDGISYSHRILIPIVWDGNVVSFQTRDITGKSERKYMACPKRREKIHHKNILYGKQEYWQDGVIVVEGVVDVWKLGPMAAATFGIEFTMEQVLQLAKVPGRIFVAFDNEPQAQRQANILAVKLRALGKDVEIATVDAKDPGEMEEEDARHFVEQLIGRRKTAC